MRVSTMFDEIGGFLAAVYPGAQLSTGLPFLDMGSAPYRKLARGQAQVVVAELLRDDCWLVTLADPTALLVNVDAVEQRGAYLEGDWSQKTMPAVQWVTKVRGFVDLEAVRTRGSAGLVVLIAPASRYVIEYGILSLFAPSAAELARVVARHPGRFQPANVY